MEFSLLSILSHSLSLKEWKNRNKSHPNIKLMNGLPKNKPSSNKPFNDKIDVVHYLSSLHQTKFSFELLPKCINSIKLLNRGVWNKVTIIHAWVNFQLIKDILYREMALQIWVLVSVWLRRIKNQRKKLQFSQFCWN